MNLKLGTTLQVGFSGGWAKAYPSLIFLELDNTQRMIPAGPFVQHGLQSVEVLLSTVPTHITVW